MQKPYTLGRPLPDELMLEILTKVDAQTWVQALQVDRQMRRVALDPAVRSSVLGPCVPATLDSVFETLHGHAVDSDALHAAEFRKVGLERKRPPHISRVEDARYLMLTTGVILIGLEMAIDNQAGRFNANLLHYATNAARVGALMGIVCLGKMAMRGAKAAYRTRQMRAYDADRHQLYGQIAQAESRQRDIVGSEAMALIWHARALGRPQSYAPSIETVRATVRAYPDYYFAFTDMA